MVAPTHHLGVAHGPSAAFRWPEEKAAPVDSTAADNRFLGMLTLIRLTRGGGMY